MSRIFIPSPVRDTSRIALIGPASRIKPDLVRSFADIYEKCPNQFPGDALDIYPSALDQNAEGSYAASLTQRVSDFKDAWSRDDVDLVICARGGYGCVHLLDYLSPAFIAAHPKWLVGFSDVSALHALLFFSGVASIHAGMVKQLVDNTDSCFGPYRTLFKSLLTSSCPDFEYSIPTHKYNIPGNARGVLLGGNLAVLNGLAATNFDLMGQCCLQDSILFIEDVSEPIYAVERMLYRLHLQGVLKNAKGILIGQFTEWRPDKNYSDIYDMIHQRFEDWKISCPVVFDFPVGHGDSNLPLIEGAPVTLEVTSQISSLKSIFTAC